MGKIVDYPSQRESLHPMAGMTKIHTLDGNERCFELSEKAKKRHELAKKAAAQGKVHRSFKKKAKVKVVRDVVVVRTGHGVQKLPVSRGTKPL